MALVWAWSSGTCGHRGLYAVRGNDDEVTKVSVERFVNSVTEFSSPCGRQRAILFGLGSCAPSDIELGRPRV
jgi:hypothetical protein